MPKRDRHRVNRSVRDGDPGRVAANERYGALEAVTLQLRAADAQHRVGEIDADDARGARRHRPRGNREIRRAGAQVEHALAPDSASA